MITRIGFTGTRVGMSRTQKHQLEDVFQLMTADLKRFTHGAAIGADTEAENLYLLLGFSKDNLRRLPAGNDPLARNRIIVANVDLLIAAPLTDKEVRRSGSWATIRYARERGIPVLQLSRGQ